MNPQPDPVDTPAAPAAIGPYSQAVRHGHLLFCSGMIPIDPATGALVDSSVAAETERCLLNVQELCAAAGTSLSATVKATVYTTELERFDEINAVYAGFFEAAPPARSTVGVAALPKGARVEIEAIVALP